MFIRENHIYFMQTFGNLILNVNGWMINMRKTGINTDSVCRVKASQDDDESASAVIRKASPHEYNALKFA